MTKQIALTQGKTTIIDDEDYERLCQYRWYAAKKKGHWYAQTSPRAPADRKVRLLMHRVILGAEAGSFVDHIDCDGLNNTRANLRLATRAENNRNRRKSKVASGPYKGITLNSVTNKWQAICQFNGTSHSLGCYDTPEEAAKAYDAGAREAYGEFANLNFPEVPASDSSESWLSRHRLGENNTSGYRGISLSSASKRWRAQIELGGVSHYLGTFDQPVDAAIAYDAALIELGGNPKRLNFPKGIE